MVNPNSFNNTDSPERDGRIYFLAMKYSLILTGFTDTFRLISHELEHFELELELEHLTRTFCTNNPNIADRVNYISSLIPYLSRHDTTFESCAKTF